MTVSLSLLAGAGWQFFDDNGTPLTGGLLYTYAAGTTTPVATYTDSTGATANANPIVLDAAGRVSQQVWLTVGSDYKFLLKTSTNVSVWSKDNIPGGMSSDDVSFLQAGTGAVTRTAQSKMRDAVSVLDFGAVGDGVTNDTAAFVAAAATGKSIFVPKGTYKASFDLSDGQIIYGEGSKNGTTIKPPAGATYVLRIDATSSAKQHCQIRDIRFDNLDAVANCVGILFKGTDVNTISDWHSLTNIWIDSFDRGVEVLGRQIWSSYYGVEILNCRIGMNVSTDTTTPAFNQNTFIQCRTAACAQEGVKIVGQNTTLGFYTCDFELCNTSNTVGKAAFYIEDCDQPSFIGCYWEANGGGVSVDGSNPANNSVGIKFSGAYCRNPKIEQTFFVGSGLLIWIAASVRGGVVANTRLDALTNGFALYVQASLAQINDPAFTYDSSNFCNSKISILQDINGNYAGRVNQTTSCYWMTATQTIDLTQTSKLMVSPNGTTFTGITAIDNRIPGQELWIWNDNATNSFTINASLIYKGSGVIAAQTGRRYMVGGFPANGKLVEM